MTQLKINGTEYPETSHDKYKCYPSEKTKNLRMMDGTLVTEVGYRYMVIEYSYDYFADKALYNACLRDLRSNRDLDVEYLPDDGDQPVRGVFKCMQKPSPAFAFSRGGLGLWHKLSFTLEAVTADA